MNSFIESLDGNIATRKTNLKHLPSLQDLKSRIFDLTWKTNEEHFPRSEMSKTGNVDLALYVETSQHQFPLKTMLKSLG